MEKIKSFQVDHDKLKPGLYTSRVDTFGDGFTVTTFDLRFTRPNHEAALSQAALHTIEHLGATFFRTKSKWKDKVIYFGPMGCKTGFYLVLAGKYKEADHYTNGPIYNLILDFCEFIINFKGEIPGATPKECGNYRKHNLRVAKIYTIRYLKDLIDDQNFKYPS